MTKKLNQYFVDARWHKKNIAELMRVWDKAFRSYQLQPDPGEARGIVDLSRAVYLAKVALLGYAEGEMDLDELLRLMEARTRRCPAGIRAELIGTVALRAQKTRPRHMGDKKPAVPRWIKAVAGEWMEQAIRENGLEPRQAAARTLKTLMREGLVTRKLRDGAVAAWHEQWLADAGRPRKAPGPAKAR